MSGQSSMAESEFIEAGPPLPRIRHARPEADFAVRIEWEDGREEVIDLAPAILSHRHFIGLRDDPQAFRRFRVRDRGDCLIWDGGQELSAEWIEQLAPSSLANSEFRQAMKDLNLSLDGMAARLGIARRLVADYRKDKPIPPAIALATRYLVGLQRKAG